MFVAELLYFEDGRKFHFDVIKKCDFNEK
jgi:hypothetical protein